MTPQRTGGDAFTKDKLTWLGRVVTDPRVSDGAKTLASLIALQFLNRKTGDAWPGQDTLAAALQVSEETIRRRTIELEAAGHLQVTASCGPGNSKRYRPVFKPGALRPTRKNTKPKTPTTVRAFGPEIPLDQVDESPTRAATNTPQSCGETPSEENPLKKDSSRHDHEASLSEEPAMYTAGQESDGGADQRHELDLGGDDFRGSVVQFSGGEVEQLCRDFPNIPNIRGTLRTCDAHYASKPPRSGDLKPRVMRWLHDDDAKAKIDRDLAHERGAEPEVVREARRYGYPVEKTKTSKGRPAWRVAGVVYDEKGVDIGQ
jgi:hypothetical protein